MTDVAPSAPLQTPSAPPDGTSPPEPQSGLRSQFEPALQQVSPQPRTPDDIGAEDAPDLSPEDDVLESLFGGKRKSAGLRGQLEALTARLGPPIEFKQARSSSSQARGESLPGLDLRAPAGSAITIGAASASVASAADLDSFADLIDQLSNTAPGAAQSFQIAIGETGLLVTRVDMTRQPDGALAVTLGTDGESLSEVRGALDALRRRLAARGLDLGDLTAEDDRFLPAQQAGRS